MEGDAGAEPARTVLVVDDDVLLLEVARAALELVGGWTVLTAKSGVEAVAVAHREQPDAVLLDVMMPGVDGPSTVDTLRSDPRTHDIPVVFLTAKGSSSERADWARRGVDGVMPKPFDPMRLSSDLAGLLGWSVPS